MIFILYLNHAVTITVPSASAGSQRTTLPGPTPVNPDSIATEI